MNEEWHKTIWIPVIMQRTGCDYDTALGAYETIKELEKIQPFGTEEPKS